MGKSNPVKSFFQHLGSQAALQLAKEGVDGILFGHALVQPYSRWAGSRLHNACAKVPRRDKTGERGFGMCHGSRHCRRIRSRDVRQAHEQSRLPVHERSSKSAASRPAANFAAGNTSPMTLRISSSRHLTTEKVDLREALTIRSPRKPNGGV